MAKIETIAVPTGKEHEGELAALSTYNYKISNAVEYEAAAAALTMRKEFARKVEAEFEPCIKQAHSLHKSMIALKKRFTDPVENVIKLITGGMSTFIAAEKAKALAAAEAIAEEQRRLAEEEKSNRAAELILGGNTVQAMEVLQEEVEVSAPVISAAIPYVPGVTIRELHRWELTDMNALVAAVAKGHIPVDALAVNEKWMNKMASDHKGGLKIPGIRFFTRDSFAA